MSEEPEYSYRFCAAIADELKNVQRIAVGSSPTSGPDNLTVGELFAAARAAIDDEDLWERFPDSYIGLGIIPEGDEKAKRPADTVRDRLIKLMAEANQG